MLKDVIWFQDSKTVKPEYFLSQKDNNWLTKTNYRHQVLAITVLFHLLVDFFLIFIFINKILITS